MMRLFPARSAVACAEFALRANPVDSFAGGDVR